MFDRHSALPSYNEEDLQQSRNGDQIKKHFQIKTQFIQAIVDLAKINNGSNPRQIIYKPKWKTENGEK